jgi:DNA-binding transcriptional LysR family regulator
MEHKLLRSFVAVAEELHFGRAAKRLHLSQPPLSAQIRKLEGDLMVRLFERDRRHVALTPAGVELYGRARRLLVEAERAAVEVQRLARGEAGLITIGYAAAATHQILPRVVPAFRAARPDVRLALEELRSRDQPAALRDGRIELGLVCAPVDAPDLVEHVLVQEKPIVVLPARHPLARREVIPVAALDGQSYVGVRSDLEPAWAQASLRALARAGVQLTLVQETDTKIALLGLVAAGLGLSVVSQSMAELGRRGVVYRPLSGLPLRLTLSVLTSRAPTARAAAFVAILRTLFTRRR